MKSNPSANRLGALLAISAALVPVVRGQDQSAPPVHVQGVQVVFTAQAALMPEAGDAASPAAAEFNRLSASAKELGKANKREEAEQQLETFLEKNKKALDDGCKATCSLEAMKAYFTAANDEAGATKYAEQLAAKYPKVCKDVEQLKAVMVKDIKAGK